MAARRVPYRPAFTGIVVAVAYVCLGPLVLILLLVFIFAGLRNELPATSLSVLALMIAVSIGSFAKITHIWLQKRKYGESICHLLTLPGVIGGWFKADVECALPLDSTESVLLSLTNRDLPTGGWPRTLWRMEQTLSVAPIPVPGTARSVLQVRLQLPRSPQQSPFGDERKLLGLNVDWILEVRRKAPGIDYYAQFPVPIFDTTDAPASEQQPV